MHAHSYVDNTDLAGKDVVVLGIGNSATDIAVESSYVAANTYLAARRGAWIVPKYMFGRPTDQLPNDPRVPFAIRRRVVHQLIKAYTGPPEKYGLPKPGHDAFGQAHPTVSGRILDRIQHGRVTPKPNIDRLEGNDVVFVDGTPGARRCRRVLHGVQDHLPVLRRGPHQRAGQPHRAVPAGLPPHIPNVASRAAAAPRRRDAALRGAGRLDRRLPHRRLRAAVPGRHGRDIAADQAAMRKRYVSSKRQHDPQVDFDDYLADLAVVELAHGAERAQMHGYALPVTHHAAAAPAEAV